MTHPHLILMAHGSPDSRWRQPFESLLRSLQEEMGHGAVSLAYMEFTHPTLEETIAGAVERGHGEFVIYPLFMAGGGHVGKDIPAQVEKVRRLHPSLSLEVLPPVGEDPLVVEAMTKRAREVLGSIGSGE